MEKVIIVFDSLSVLKDVDSEDLQEMLSIVFVSTPRDSWVFHNLPQSEDLFEEEAQFVNEMTAANELIAEYFSLAHYKPTEKLFTDSSLEEVTDIRVVSFKDDYAESLIMEIEDLLEPARQDKVEIAGYGCSELTQYEEDDDNHGEDEWEDEDEDSELDDYEEGDDDEEEDED
jgi:hypothetical protein